MQNSEFKLARLPLKIDLVSNPARAEELIYIYIYIYIYTNLISTSIHGTRKKKEKNPARNKR